MKKRYIIILCALIALGSCKKTELDLFPYNAEETSQAFNTQADVTLAVNGMYYGIRASGSYYNGTWNIVPDVLADNLIISSAGRGTLTTYGQYLYNPTNTYPLFSGGYTMTRRANAILENIDKFAAGAFHDDAKAQALAIRGMTYFDMSRVYSKTYLNATTADSTLPYVTTTDPTIMPKKEALKGFYDKVITDLTTAYPLINNAATNTVNKLNKEAVAGLLSRVYLYKGDWLNCIAMATNALGATPNVPTIANFPKIWTDDSNLGVLFSVINTATDNINTQGVNYYQTQGNPAEIKSEYVVEYNFFQQFTTTDVRKSTYIKTSTFSGNTFNNVIKYAGGTGKPAGVCNAKVIRTAEVLLNRAEAYYMNSNPGAALADLNLLKSNRYTGFVNIVGLTGQPLLDEIYKERRLELAFEGDRFFDLKRRNLPVTRDPSKGDRADGSGVAYIVTSLPVGSYKFQFPFPSSETNFNKNLTQNPGW